MARKITITLTEDMIRLISCIQFQEFPEYDREANVQDLQNMDDEAIEKRSRYQYVRYGVDLNSLYGGNFVLEDVSRILGVYDKHIPNTEENAEGPRFPKEIEDYLIKVHLSVFENLEYIEQILHQYCWKGGITPGTYERKDYEYNWIRKD